MLVNLLESVTESVPSSTGTGTPKNNTQQIIIWIILGVLLVGFIVMNYFSNKKRKAQMEAEKEKRNAIKPGFKIMTIGGIVGTVVSVDDEANTFVLQTGSDENPNYIKFDKVAIYSSEDPNEASGSDAHEEDIMPVSDPEETKEKVEEGLAEEKTEEEKSEEDTTENKE